MNWIESEKLIYDQALRNVERSNRALVRVYLTVQREIEDELKQFFISINPSWSAQYQAQRLSEIFTTINTRLSKLTKISEKTIEKAFLGQYQETFNTYAYNLSDYYSSPQEFKILPFIPNDESIIKTALNEKIGEYSFKDSLGNQRTILQQQLKESVAVSIVKGEGPYKLAVRLDDAFGHSISRIVSTARTELLRSYSLAQEESFVQAVNMGISFKYQWLAASDSRTRPEHSRLSGKFATEFDKDDKPIFHVGKSRGSGPRLLTGPDQAAQNINCRCRKLAIPLDISDEDMQNFPMINKRPDYAEYLKMIT